MKIAVCVKHVPEGSSRLDPGSKRLDRSGEGALNHFDANAVEEALRGVEGLLRLLRQHDPSALAPPPCLDLDLDRHPTTHALCSPTSFLRSTGHG